MSKKVIEVLQTDITKLEVDAIVNASNSTLRGGGGVDGAIHRAAGAGLHQACLTLGGCDTGDAKVTPGFDLPAKWVIHAVGPIWHGGGVGEEEKLASCYRRALEEAEKLGVKSIAFPAISTGIYGFPKEMAAEIAVNEVKHYLRSSEFLDRLIFACFDLETALIYKKLLDLP